ncbi:hypothetical protein CG716_06210 [Mycolicibacterium sphagni]|uniref:Uncharacterized protein n=1 Tax=Mycolicibacterium sphagni TaxID=1786 RepID=A0A255DV53_9MYCO|nr:hypothetical protein CG716_06210 [Mycolicibacterium sphagni]
MPASAAIAAAPGDATFPLTAEAAAGGADLVSVAEPAGAFVAAEGVSLLAAVGSEVVGSEGLAGDDGRAAAR